MNLHFLRNILRWSRPAKADGPVVVSFPKSGRTWLRVMLINAGVEADYSHAGSDHIGARTADELVSELEDYRDRRVLFLLRDPRDTVVSGFFQATKRIENFSGDIHSFLRSPRHGIEKVVRFNLLWLENGAGFRDFCAIHYEDIHADPAAELARAASFLTGEDVDPLRIADAVESGRFDRMRKLEATGTGEAAYGDWLAPAKAGDTDTYKTRRGIVGGWRDYLNDEDKSYAQGVLDRYDYPGKVETTRRFADS